MPVTFDQQPQLRTTHQPSPAMSAFPSASQRAAAAAAAAAPATTTTTTTTTINSNATLVPTVNYTGTEHMLRETIGQVMDLKDIASQADLQATIARLTEENRRTAEAHVAQLQEMERRLQAATDANIVNTFARAVRSFRDAFFVFVRILIVMFVMMVCLMFYIETDHFGFVLRRSWFYRVGWAVSVCVMSSFAGIAMYYLMGRVTARIAN